jgi:hypothetical protein
MAIKTFTTGEVLTASDTNTYLANSGLVYVTTLTISSATSGFTDAAFTSDFTNYRIVGNWNTTSAVNMVFTFRNSSGDVTAANYKYNSAYMTYVTTPAWVFDGSAGTSNFPLFARAQNSGEQNSFAYDIFNPQTATITTVSGSCTDGFLWRNMNGLYNATTQMVGFKLSASTNITGTFAVYGYRKA